MTLISFSPAFPRGRRFALHRRFRAETPGLENRQGPPRSLEGSNPSPSVRGRNSALRAGSRPLATEGALPKRPDGGRSGRAGGNETLTRRVSLTRVDLPFGRRGFTRNTGHATELVANAAVSAVSAARRCRSERNWSDSTLGGSGSRRRPPLASASGAKQAPPTRFHGSRCSSIAQATRWPTRTDAHRPRRSRAPPGRWRCLAREGCRRNVSSAFAGGGLLRAARRWLGPLSLLVGLTSGPPIPAAPRL
jgi:hypothetical protein